MSRYLSLYFPWWSVDVARRLFTSEEQATHRAHGLFLVQKVANQLCIKRCCEKGVTAGVHGGMALPLANALLPDAYVKDFDPIQDLLALYKLGLWCLRFTPVVGLDPEIIEAIKQKQLEDLPLTASGLVLDITGTEKVHKGEEPLARKLIEKFTATGLHARIAISSTLGSAWALSRYADDPLVILPEHFGLEDALRPLPIAALRVGDAAVGSLRQVGIKTIAELLRAPKKSLGVRFGTKVLARLDQALGRLPEPLVALQLAPRFAAKRSFEVPLTNHAAIVQAILSLFKEVLAKLNKKGRKAGVYILNVESEKLDYQRVSLRKEISLHAATKNFLHVKSVIEPIIESLQIPGGVVHLEVHARNTEQTEAEQGGILAEEAQEVSNECVNEFLNNLVVRLGSGRVAQVHFTHSHIPEKSYRYQSVQGGASKKPPAPSGLMVTERPTYIFPQPEHVTAIAMLPDKPPAWVKWNGETLRIVKGVGPERISAEWWHAQLSDDREYNNRDYFKVQDHIGRWLWVYRNLKNSEWFVHGMWV